MLPRRLYGRWARVGAAAGFSAVTSMGAGVPAASVSLLTAAVAQQRLSASAAAAAAAPKPTTATSGSNASFAGTSGLEISNVHSDFSALIGVGWARDEAKEATTIASEITLFCHRTQRTTVVPIPETLRGPTAVAGGAEVNALREQVRAFVDPSLKSAVADISGAARAQVHVSAVFLPHQNDATAQRLRTLLVMPPCDRPAVAPAGASTAVRAYYMVPPRDAWGLMYAFALEQRRVIKGLPVPTSLVEVHNLFAPAPFEVLEGETEAARWARLGVHACMAATLRFAGPHAFSESPLISKEGQVAAAVVARCILPVRTFVISVVRKGKSVADRLQFEVKTYDPVNRASKSLPLTGFTDEKKMAEFAKVLGRPSSLTVLLPAPSCDPRLVVSFVRSLKVTNPVYIFNEQALKSTAEIAPSTKADGGARNAMSDVWADLAARTTGGAECVLSVATILARDRHRVASSGSSTSTGVPAQALLSAEDIASLHRQSSQSNIVMAPAAAATADSGEAPSADLHKPVKSTSPVGQVSAPATAKHVTSSAASLGDSKMSLDKQLATQEKLNAWNAMIYSNPRRDEQEREELKKIEKWLVIDLETTTNARYKRKANPFLPENHVVLPGFLDYEGKMTIPKKYLGSREEFKLPDLSKYQVIVGHNIKFDLHYMWRDPELIKFWERGGKVWDTMYGEYIISGHSLKLGKGAGLEDIARSYGGQTPKLDVVKQAWANGVATQDIDHAILAEYLEGDLRNTALIFEKQRQRAFANRQVVIVNARMDSLLCTTEMEYNGLAIDRELAKKQEAELEAKLTALKASMRDMIPASVPSYYRRQFNWGSLPTLTAFVWGGDMVFTPPESRSSLRVPDATLYAGVDNVSCPAQLAWLASCLGPKVVKKYTEQYMREMGFRTNNVYSEVFDDAVIERKFDLYHAAIRTSFDADFAAKHNCDGGAPLPAIDAPEIANATLDEISVACPVRNVAFRGEIVAAGGSSKPKEETVDGFATTVVRGTVQDVVAGLKAFFVKHSGADGRAIRRPILLGRNFAEYGIEVLRRHGVDPEMLRDVFDEKAIGEAAAAAKAANAAANDADEEGDAEESVESASPTVPEPTVFFGDSLPIEEHAGYFFPEVCADAREKCLGITTDMLLGTKAAAGAGKKRGKTAAAAMPKKADATLHAVKSERMLFEKAAGNTLAVATRVARFNQALAEGVTATYCKNKSQADPNSLPAKRRAKPKRDVPDLAPIDTLFEQKGIGATSYLDRGFTTVPGADPSKAAEGSSAELRRLVALRHVGALLSTHDVFINRLDEEPPERIAHPGRIHEFVPEAAERDALKAKFTSAETGQLQVDINVLKLMGKAGDAVCKTIVEMRGLEKMLSTYYDEKRTGMMALVHEHDSCIHHELQHNKTATGRLASQNPNCQNIPKEDKSEIRDLFVSRFTNAETGEQGLCIESDYSQLEVVALCALSHDVNMTKDLKNKVDFHCKRVTLMRPEFTYEEVVQKAKKDKIPEFVKMRQQAKIFSFQRQYGAGVKMLSESTGLSPEVVRALIENEAKTYYGVDQFYDMVTLSCNTFDASLQDGARSKTGSPIFKGAFAVLSGSQYVFTESDMPPAILDSMRRRGEAITKTTTFSPTHLKNYPVQGFAGEIVQIMLGRLWRYFVDKKNYGGKALLTNTVHDCVWVDARKEVAKEVAADVDRILSSARDVLNELFPEMDVDVDFPTDTVAGETMGSVRSIKDIKWD